MSRNKHKPYYLEMRKIVKNRFLQTGFEDAPPPRDCDSGDEELSQHFTFSDENIVVPVLL